MVKWKAVYILWGNIIKAHEILILKPKSIIFKTYQPKKFSFTGNLEKYWEWEQIIKGEQHLTSNNNLLHRNSCKRSSLFFKFWVQMYCWSKWLGGQVTSCSNKVHHRLDWPYVIKRYVTSKNYLENFRVKKKLPRCSVQLNYFKVECLFCHALFSWLLFSKKSTLLLVYFAVESLLKFIIIPIT